MVSKLKLVRLNTGSTPIFHRPGNRETTPGVSFVNEHLTARNSDWQVIEDYSVYGVSSQSECTSHVEHRQARPREIGFGTRTQKVGPITYSRYLTRRCASTYRDRSYFEISILGLRSSSAEIPSQ